MHFLVKAKHKTQEDNCHIYDETYNYNIFILFLSIEIQMNGKKM